MMFHYCVASLRHNSSKLIFLVGRCVYMSVMWIIIKLKCPFFCAQFNSVSSSLLVFFAEFHVIEMLFFFHHFISLRFSSALLILGRISGAQLMCSYSREFDDRSAVEEKRVITLTQLYSPLARPTTMPFSRAQTWDETDNVFMATTYHTQHTMMTTIAAGQIFYEFLCSFFLLEHTISIGAARQWKEVARAWEIEQTLNRIIGAPDRWDEMKSPRVITSMWNWRTLCGWCDSDYGCWSRLQVTNK